MILYCYCVTSGRWVSYTVFGDVIACGFVVGRSVSEQPAVSDYPKYAANRCSEEFVPIYKYARRRILQHDFRDESC
jgi:hypothetical protein